jgi:hypothetical protein
MSEYPVWIDVGNRFAYSCVMFGSLSIMIGLILGSPPIMVSVSFNPYKNGSTYPNNSSLTVRYWINPPNPTSTVMNLTKVFSKVIFFQ